MLFLEIKIVVLNWLYLQFCKIIEYNKGLFVMIFFVYGVLCDEFIDLDSV